MHQSIIRILYNFALLLLLVLGSPWWLFRLVTSGKFREGMGQRFFGPSAAFASSLPHGPRIWVHAVSVGEVLAVSGLVQELERRLPTHTILISTTTRTGQKLARERFGRERCFYFPLDFPWSLRAVITRLRPSILALAESELWPNVLEFGSRTMPVVVVNARVSDRSLPRYRRLGLLWRPFLKLLSTVLAQTPEDARRLIEIGVPVDRVHVGGNLKFDVRAPLDLPIMHLLRQSMRPEARLLVCGSTLEGEEALLLQAWPHIVQAVPEAVMLLAPRHPERFEKVATLLQSSGRPWTRRSAFQANVVQASAAPLPPGSIFLLDSIGELASLYALASVAFVGGSLVPAGGHNPLEPAQFGVPVTMGPHYENFRAIGDLLVEQAALRIVQPETLDTQLISLLLAEEPALGRNAKQVFEAQAGATARAADAIVHLLGEPV